MISTILVEHPWMTTVALVVLVVVGPVLGAALARRPRVAYGLAGTSLVPVALLTLVPTARELPRTCAVEWSVPTLGAVELMANVVLFAAPVLLVAVATHRPPLVLAGASALSAVIELVQALMPALGRSCSTNDWLSNTVGAGLGVGLAVAALRLAEVRRVPQPSRGR